MTGPSSSRRGRYTVVGVSDDFHQGSASWASPEVPMAKYGWYCDGRRGSLGVIVRERAAR